MESDLNKILEDCFRNISMHFSGNIDDYLKLFPSESVCGCIKKKIADIDALMAREQTKKNSLTFTLTAI